MDRLCIVGSLPKGFGKSLQLYLDKEPYLVVGDSSIRHHAILKSFLSQHKIPFSEGMLNGPEFGPLAFGEHYQLVGAGRAVLYYSDKIVLSGSSDSYRISSDKKHAREISNLLTKKVKIERVRPLKLVTPKKRKPIRSLDDEFPF